MSSDLWPPRVMELRFVALPVSAYVPLSLHTTHSRPLTPTLLPLPSSATCLCPPPLPPRVIKIARRERAPQRVCDMCATLLDPLQPFLVGATAACVQPPVHDALDAVSLRSWLNTPWSSSMADEVFKAANIVNAFSQVRFAYGAAGVVGIECQGRKEGRREGRKEGRKEGSKGGRRSHSACI